MSAFDDPLFLAEEFLGKVRVFPLPDVVLFPHVMQPLRIFEPRYRELLEDALAGDGLIAVAALAPGWEKTTRGGRCSTRSPASGGSPPTAGCPTAPTTCCCWDCGGCGC